MSGTSHTPPNDACPMHKGMDYAEPCVKVTKLRSIDAGVEVWEPWCIKHHHWLNGAQAIPIVETL